MSPRELGTGDARRDRLRRPTPTISSSAWPPRLPRADPRPAAGADQRRRVPQRPAPVRALGRGRAGSSSRRSPPSRSTISPSASSPRRASGEPRPHPGQPGPVRQRPALRRRRRAGRARPARRPVGGDRRLSRLHGDRAAVRRRPPRSPPSTSAAATNMRWPGEGCAFLHCAARLRAAAAGHRLVRRVRGSDPAAGQRRLCQRRDALHGRDLRSVGALPLQRRPADARRRTA